MPGGGGIGRPDGLIGRPGGGGIGRPDALSGGRVAEPGASVPSAALGRCVGRMVVGPSLGVTRGGAGLGAGAGRLRTTRGASGAGTSNGVSSCATVATGAGDSDRVVSGRVDTVGESSTVGATTGVALLAVRADLVFEGSSGATSRRKPSASALRRMRSAWASSIEAEGLDAPIPSVWASASNSLLVRPSSLESSCTRIFFCAKTFPCIVCSQSASTILYSSTTTTVFERSTTSRSAAASNSPSAHRSAREACDRCTRVEHSPSRHHHNPRPTPRPRYQSPFASRPQRCKSVSTRR